MDLYEGNYTDYLKYKEQKKHPPIADIESPPDSESGLNRKRQKRLEAEARQRVSGIRRKLTHKIADLEAEIEMLEEEKKHIETKMSDPSFYKSDVSAAETGRRYQELQLKIPSLVRLWEEAHIEMETIISSLDKGK